MKLERPATIALPEGGRATGLALEGLYRPAHDTDRGGAVIAPPHPLYGGSMESPVVGEMAHGFERAGIATLRFNWRGVGASAGEVSGDLAVGQEDYLAALDFLADTLPPPLIASGYSFGAAAALAASAGPLVRRLVLVSPPPALLDRDRLADFHGKILIATGAWDEVAPARELEGLEAPHAELELRVLEETDHFFMGGPGLRELAAALVDWLG
ncbi:MAG: alpha/beta fold hydrolase [Deltaproteobacteria bacterium]|nr:alpha/beta fold hydrolase [Deltaproteobacteria bacterium]